MAGFRLLDLVETPTMTLASTPIAMATIRTLLPMLPVAAPQTPLNRTCSLLQPEHSEEAGWIPETTQICPTMSSTRSGSRLVPLTITQIRVRLAQLCQVFESFRHADELLAAGSMSAGQGRSGDPSVFSSRNPDPAMPNRAGKVF